MAARDKKAPAGSGITNKRQNSGVSPVPLRENNSPLTNTSANTTMPATSQTETSSTEANLTENDSEASTQSNEDKTDTKKGAKAKDDLQTKKPETQTASSTDTAGAAKATPKRGGRRLPPPKRNVGIKNKLKTDLKAKSKVVRRKPIAKRITTAANIEFEENPEKKTTLMKNGIKNTTKLNKKETTTTSSDENKPVTPTKVVKKKQTKLTNWGKKLGEFSPTIVEKHLENLDQVINEMIAKVSAASDNEDDEKKESEKKSEPEKAAPSQKPENEKSTENQTASPATETTTPPATTTTTPPALTATTPSVTVTTPTKKGRKIVKKNILGQTAAKKRQESAKRQKMEEQIAKDTELDSDAQNVINQLGLVVTAANLEKTVEIKKRRRHSIEKAANFSLNDTKRLNTVLQPDFTTQLLSTTVPRSGSPRSKRGGTRLARLARSTGVELLRMGKRSPYSTRSDSPARILRNGKHRKLKDSQLLDGTELEHKKKRRIHSDSREGSEVSKNSGYWSESESSYCESTVSAIENGVPDIQLDIDPLKPLDDKKEPETPTEIKNEELPTAVVLETSMPEDMQTDNIDSENNNSKIEIKDKLIDVEECIPEKVIILNKMAKNFNDVQDTATDVAWKKSPRDDCQKNLKDEKIEELKVDDNSTDIEIVDDNNKTVSTKPLSSEEKTDTKEEKTIDNDNDILDISDNSINFNNSIENTSDFVLKLELSSEDISLSPEKDPLADDDDDQAIKDETLKVLENMVDKISDDDFMENDSKLTDELKENTIENILKSIDVPMEPTPTVIINDSVLKSLDLNTVDVTSKSVEPSKNSLENILITAHTNLIIETPENQVIKESILNALGLQSLKAAAEAKVAAKSKRILNRNTAQGTTDSSYTGTLKTVIKINRSPEKKKGRGHLKMTFQKSKSKNYTSNGGDLEGAGSSPDMDNNTYYKVMKEVNNAAWSTGAQSSDTADGSSEHMSDEGGAGDGEEASGSSGKAKTLVIPEKASSFSIHPQRLCRDECCYCFGRFGLFDTPCHIAQMKSSERQRKILEIEKHLTPDSCLCDACYRHVDRKANVPSYSKQQFKRSNSAGPTNVGPRICHALGCQQDATHSVRRKWILKMKRNIQQSVQFDLDPTQGLHSIPVCETHFEALERLMACAMCKRRLPRNHAHSIGFPEAETLNEAFEQHKLPIRLATASASTSTDGAGGDDNKNMNSGCSVVCKLCNYWASLLLKPPDNARSHTISFFESYEKRLLHFHDGELIDDPETDDTTSFTVPKLDRDINKQAGKKNRKKLSKTLSTKHSISSEQPPQSQETSNDPPPLTAITTNESSGGTSSALPEEIVQPELMETDPPSRPENTTDNSTQSQRVPSTDENRQKSRSNSPKLDTENDVPEAQRTNKEVPQKAIFLRRLPKDSKYIVELHKVSNKDNNPPKKFAPSSALSGSNQKVVERLETNPSISVRQLFPGEDDLSLQGSVEFGNVKERTPEGWEKCAMTIQYDHDTKRLWQELQKPYGNHSSFLRHLILLEKYFRNGDLILTPNASHHATNYCESVQNRLRAYDNIPSHGATNMQPLAMLPFNTPPSTLPRKQTISQSGIITGIGNNSTTIKPQIPKTSTPLLGNSYMPPNFVSPVNILRQQRPPSVPPGLIQLQQPSSAPTVSRSQSTILRFPTNVTAPNRRPFMANRVHKQIQRPTLIPLTQNKVAATITSGALTQKSIGGDIKRPPGLVQVMSGGKAYHLSISDYNRMCAIKQREGIDLRPIPKKIVSSGGQTNTTSGVLNTVSVLRQRSPNLTAQITPKDNLGPNNNNNNTKSVLDQLKSSVQNLNESVTLQSSPPNLTQIDTSNPNNPPTTEQKKHVMILPKIPKSLTVIPQTVRKSIDTSPNHSATTAVVIPTTTCTPFTNTNTLPSAATAASLNNNKQPS
ncbi:uncharacterized protein LOC123298996 isoform X2 [Chrysoperla carnea]|uniref:uncharacterized protein LOC123298996 isoform X2 n=1 Tax=Chrysoperla carnea TaxID=189513 RepID=UPI001D0630BD|nr:uncharacterized protein LOC123298996 isoform X2 [Chrysoperla carnea]